MNRLQAELHRLYAQAEPDTASEAKTRAAVLSVAGPGAWSALSAAWRGVQADLELPAPAIAISGDDSLQLWFSLARPVATAQARALLEGVRRDYLAGLPAARTRIAVEPGTLPAYPPQPVAPERWSAFVTPDLAPLFDDEPWLDQPAGPDAQADLLARLQPASPREFEQAMARLAPATQAPVHETVTPAPAALATATALEPRAFLRQVMNDPSVDLALRIEAAKALLPHTAG